MGGDGNGKATNGVVSALGPTQYGGDRVDFLSTFAAIAERKRLVFGVALVVFTFGVAYTFTRPVEFGVEASLYLGDLENHSPADALDLFGGASQRELATEIEILKSRQLVSRAIVDTGLNVALAPSRPRRVRLWRWLFSGRDPALFDARPGDLFARSSSVSRDLARRELEVAFDGDGRYAVRAQDRVVARGRLGQRAAGDGLDLRLDTHGGVPPPPGSRYALVVTPPDAMYDGIMRRFDQRTPKDATIVRCAFSDTSPNDAVGFVEALMHAYLEQHLLWKTEEAGATESFIIVQLEKIRQSLSDSEQRLADFKTTSGNIVLSEEATAMISQVAAYEQQKSTLELEASALEDITRSLKKPDAPLESYLVSQDPILSGLSSTLVTAQQELKRLRLEFTEDADVVKSQTELVNKQRELIAGYVSTNERRVRQQVAELDRLIGKFEERLRRLPDAELKLAALTRSSEVLGRIYSVLLERQEQAALLKASTILKSRVLDRPMLPEREAAPRLWNNLAISALAGLFLGLFALYVRRAFAPSFQSEGEVRRAFPGLPVFAAMPTRTLRTGEWLGRPAAGSGAVLERNHRSIFAESFRLLRTNIYYSGNLESSRLILVTSPSPSDGKTLITLNLASALALDNKRVLVIDADLRKPAHHELLHIPQHPGLSSILAGELDWREVRRTYSESPGRLDVIPAGFSPPNPAEMLSSSTFARVLDQARREYDFVLLDSPPFPLVSDALVLAMLADRVLTVLRVSNSRRDWAEDHVRGLAGLGKPYGLVLNDVALPHGYGYGYAYGGKDDGAPANGAPRPAGSGPGQPKGEAERSVKS